MYLIITPNQRPQGSAMLACVGYSPTTTTVLGLAACTNLHMLDLDDTQVSDALGLATRPSSRICNCVAPATSALMLPLRVAVPPLSSPGKVPWLWRYGGCVVISETSKLQRSKTHEEASLDHDEGSMEG